jgi:hypothetical protein
MMERSAVLEAPGILPKSIGRKFNNEKIDVRGEVIRAGMIGRRDEIVRCGQIRVETARAEIDDRPTSARCATNLKRYSMGRFDVLTGSMPW